MREELVSSTSSLLSLPGDKRSEPCSADNVSARNISLFSAFCYRYGLKYLREKLIH